MELEKIILSEIIPTQEGDLFMLFHTYMAPSSKSQVYVHSL